MSEEVAIPEYQNGEGSRKPQRSPQYLHPNTTNGLRKSRSKEFFNSSTQKFAAGSHLPHDFFRDVNHLQQKVSNRHDPTLQDEEITPNQQTSADNLKAQIDLLKSVRDLELKLAKAKEDLEKSMLPTHSASNSHSEIQDGSQIVLSKDDYLGLVDLYFYSHSSRFTPESPDSSPTPLFLDDYSFRLSEDFRSPMDEREYNEDENYESPLKQIEEMLKSRQLREISLMKAFVDLLLDDNSSNRALFEIYQKFPKPGVAYLPQGMIRLFLQRMATPWMRSEKSMLRYLSIIDDMQQAKLPITSAEWSSAIYHAGRAFSRVTETDVNSAFAVWRRMEQEAGVQATNVTFNILFDIAVRAGKFNLVEAILKEMHSRELRLNRLGRVSLIYYQGLRGDGDGVRKVYRDFVEAGEIVDTVVLNCVIASLLNAQEPAAAELVYERMKNLQTRLREGQREDGQGTLYARYPKPGSSQIGRDMAANSLGRVLLPASRLKGVLPDHHAELQNSMPLTPDHITFRAMISYHANVSGDLDRITVLMNEMTELFDLPLQSINFQLLFKGFALHGERRKSDSTWNPKRLDMVWDVFLEAIKDTQKRRAGNEDYGVEENLPTVTEMDTITTDVRLEEPKAYPKFKKLSVWNDFVLDLAAYPYKRRKHIERIHAQLFDEEAENQQSKFINSFFPPSTEHHDTQQQTYYPIGQSHLDSEEGEYILPSPTHTADPSRPLSTDDSIPSMPPHVSSQEASPSTSQPDMSSPHDVAATRALICWVLRAYARCTGSKTKIEMVWESIRKIWHPLDELERNSVIRVLRRCLKECDRFG